MDTGKPSSYNRNQLLVLFGFVLLNALLAVLYYLLIPSGGLSLPGYTQPATNIPNWLLGLANAGIVLVLYSLAGLAGYWFARRLGLPGIFLPGATWHSWFLIPLITGVLVGILLVLDDLIFMPWIRASFALTNPDLDWAGFIHPPFPLSIIASATAAIGEEILFRGFVLGLWAFLLNLILRRWSRTRLALWIANLIAALAFAASHLGTAMVLTGVSTPALLPVPLIMELFLLNGILGLVAGERYFKDGLVAAIGVHFWADIVWHVIAPVLM